MADASNDPDWLKQGREDKKRFDEAVKKAADKAAADAAKKLAEEKKKANEKGSGK